MSKGNATRIISNEEERNLVKTSLNMDEDQLSILERRKVIYSVLLGMHEAGIKIDDATISAAIYLVFALNTYNQGIRSAGIIGKTLMQEKKTYIKSFVDAYQALLARTSNGLLSILQGFHNNIHIEPGKVNSKVGFFQNTMQNIADQLGKPNGNANDGGSTPGLRKKPKEKVNDNDKIESFLTEISQMWFSDEKENPPFKMFHFDKENGTFRIQKQPIYANNETESRPIMKYRKIEDKERKEISFHKRLRELGSSLRNGNPSKNYISHILRKSDLSVSEKTFFEVLQKLCKDLFIDFSNEEENR